VTQDVARELLLEPGLNGQRDEDVASTACGQAATAVVEEESGVGVGARPICASAMPA
jgi:hypothetical protein